MVLLLAGLYGLVSPLFGQVAIVNAYGVNDGLISNDIRCFFQDSKGILWIGTMDGLSIYDGHRFRNFSKSNGLAHDVINDFFEEKESISSLNILFRIYFGS